MYANAETSTLLRHRDKCLQKALALIATASGAVQYSDFCDSQVHIHHYQSMGLFQDKQDIALALSTDGAQLTLKRQSDTWILILMVLNMPPEIRYKLKTVIYPFSIPGPNPPGNIESYLYVLFEDMAMASEGIWMWDAVDSSYFVHRAYICMALGDMFGSAKLNGMAGHSAIYGDCFNMVKGAKTCKKKVQKLNTIQSHHLQLQWSIMIVLHITFIIYHYVKKTSTGKPLRSCKMPQIKLNAHQSQRIQAYHRCHYVQQVLHFFIHLSSHLIHFTCFMKIAWHLFGTFG